MVTTDTATDMLTMDIMSAMDTMATMDTISLMDIMDTMATTGTMDTMDTMDMDTMDTLMLTIHMEAIHMSTLADTIKCLLMIKTINLIHKSLTLRENRIT